MDNPPKIRGLIIDEDKLVNAIIEKNLHKDMAKDVVSNFFNYELGFGIKVKFLFIAALMSTIIFKIMRR